MIEWKGASEGDLRLLKAIKIVMEGHEKLINFMFHPEKARLVTSSDIILKHAACFSTGEVILIKIVLDIWDNSGKALLKEMFETLDYKKINQISQVMASLR